MVSGVMPEPTNVGIPTAPLTARTSSASNGAACRHARDNYSVCLEKLGSFCGFDDIDVSGYGVSRVLLFDIGKDSHVDGPDRPAISKQRPSGRLNQTFVSHMSEHKPLHPHKTRAARVRNGQSPGIAAGKNLDSQRQWNSSPQRRFHAILPCSKP